VRARRRRQPLAKRYGLEGGLGHRKGKGRRWAARARGDGLRPRGEREGPEGGESPRLEGVLVLFIKSFSLLFYFRKPVFANCFESAPIKVEFEYRVEIETK
jgi:hypothetical protein